MFILGVCGWHFVGLVDKTIVTYVQCALAYYISATCHFDLCLSKGVCMIFLLLLTCLANGRPNMLLLDCLKCLTLAVQLWLPSYNNFLISFHVPIRSLLTLRMRTLIYRLVQVHWTWLFHMLAWLWCNKNQGHWLLWDVFHFIISTCWESCENLSH